MDYEEHFPFGIIRPEQKKAIEFAIENFQSKKFVILEMGTGCGKSATAITIARYFQHQFETSNANTYGCYILTPQKVLQEQYKKDFGKPNGKGDLKSLKSATSYCCKMFENEFTSCAEIQRLLASKSPIGMLYELCVDKCLFKEARAEFHKSPECVTNYAYFLAMSAYSREIDNRHLLILDEAHNIENAVSSFVKISFSNHFYKNVLGVRTPHANSKQKVVYDWLVNTCRPRLKEVIRIESRKFSQINDQEEALERAKKLESLKRNFSKLEKFVEIYDENTWVLDQAKTDKRGERIYEFKPIVVAKYCEQLLFMRSTKVLLLSATILDREVFCNSLGIDHNDVAFLRIPSPFDASKRPIHILPVGSMSKNAIDKTLPKMSSVIQTILAQHHNQKGIIHCANFKIAQFLKESLDDERLLTHDSDNREQVIKYHLESKSPSVLLSPSMTEGVDLADDASRFQIICKLPFPYLGDIAVQKRMELDPKWYSYQTVKTIVQSMGRSIRNESDHAISYILDGDWVKFYKNNNSMFPQEFKDAIS